MKINRLSLIALLVFLTAGLLLAGARSVDGSLTDSQPPIEEEVEETWSENFEEECTFGGSRDLRFLPFAVELAALTHQHNFTALNFSPNGSSAFRLSHWMVPLRI